MENTNRRVLNKKTLLSVILTLIVICIFIGVIVFYYRQYYSTKRTMIIKDCQLDAINSSVEINELMSACMASIDLAGSTIDSIISSGGTREEILKALVDFSYSTEAVLNVQSEGVYGYIKGEFLDGSGWVPPEGFESTERPWYKVAMSKPDKVVVVDPYLDVHTNDIMITFAKALSGGNGVVAFDIKPQLVQNKTEDASNTGAGPVVKFIINSSNFVVSHTDTGEIGKEYNTSDYSLNSQIVRKIREINETRGMFTLIYSGNEYFVFNTTVGENWVCVSVTNASSQLKALNNPLYVTVILSLAIVVFLIYMLIRTSRKDRQAEKMKELAEEEIKVAHRSQLTGLLNRRAYSEEIDRLADGLPESLCIVILDINSLKHTNDTYGHKTGDRLIKASAECLRRAFPGVETLYRIGGDEFCVIVREKKQKVEECLRELDRLTAEWREPDIEGFSISHGVASTEDHEDIDSMVSDADKNMYDNKNSFYSRSEHDRRRHKDHTAETL